jgi:micrococcal nuclease
MDDRCFFYRAKVLGVHDGDTITVDIDLGFNIILSKIKVRLNGIDTAEIYSKNEELRLKAVAARDWLSEKILGKDVYIDSRGLDKYGRWLGVIHTKDNVCCNDELIKMGLALSYFGEKKNQELLKG